MYGTLHQVYSGISTRSFYIFPLLLSGGWEEAGDTGEKESSIVVGKQPGRVSKARTEMKHYYVMV